MALFVRYRDISPGRWLNLAQPKSDHRHGYHKEAKQPTNQVFARIPPQFFAKNYHRSGEVLCRHKKLLDSFS
jgi:hypothetical protein